MVDLDRLHDRAERLGRAKIDVDGSRRKAIRRREQVREVPGRRIAAEQAVDECAHGHGAPAVRRWFVKGVAARDEAADDAAAEREADLGRGQL